MFHQKTAQNRQTNKQNHAHTHTNPPINQTNKKQQQQEISLGKHNVGIKIIYILLRLARTLRPCQVL